MHQGEISAVQNAVRGWSYLRACYSGDKSCCQNILLLGLAGVQRGFLRTACVCEGGTEKMHSRKEMEGSLLR